MPAAVTIAALVLAGCGGGEDPAVTAPSGSESTAGLADAEVAFLQSMLPHHKQATEMAQLASERSEREELRTFADKIIADQSAEIDQMTSLLEAAGEDVDGDQGMGGGSEAMSDADMAELEAASGDEFDLMFLDMMTRHHEAAIEMAEKVLEEEPSPSVTTLASTIIEAQNAEIAQMDTWREEWAG